MEIHCVSCEKNIANRNTSVKRTKQNTLMLASYRAICSKKKARFPNPNMGGG